MSWANNRRGWQMTKKLMKSWKIWYASGLLSTVVEPERAKIEKYVLAAAARPIASLPLKTSKRVKAALLPLSFCNWQLCEIAKWETSYVSYKPSRPMSFSDENLTPLLFCSDQILHAVFFCLFKIFLLRIRWGESRSDAPCWRRRGTEGTCSPRRLLEFWRTQPASHRAPLEAHQPAVPAKISCLCRSTEGCSQSCVFLALPQCNQFPFRGSPSSWG